MNWIKILLGISIIVSILDVISSWDKLALEMNPLVVSNYAMIGLKAIAIVALYFIYRGIKSPKTGDNSRFLLVAFLLYYTVLLCLVVANNFTIEKSEAIEFEEKIKELEKAGRQDVVQDITIERQSQVINLMLLTYLLPLINSFLTFLLYKHAKRKYLVESMHN